MTDELPRYEFEIEVIVRRGDRVVSHKKQALPYYAVESPESECVLQAERHGREAMLDALYDFGGMDSLYKGFYWRRKGKAA